MKQSKTEILEILGTFLSKKKIITNKSYQQNVDAKIREWFLNIYKFSNHTNDKFLLLLWKGVVYPYKYLDDWEKFNERSLTKK